MMVSLDSLKDMKASLLNEFSLFKRIFEKVKPSLTNSQASAVGIKRSLFLFFHLFVTIPDFFLEEQIRVFQNFAVDPKVGSKNVIFFKFRDELQKKLVNNSLLY